MARVLILLLMALCGCSSNTVQIGPQAGNAAIRVTDDGVYVNPGLLGFQEPGQNITIRKNFNNTLSLDVEPEAEAGDSLSTGKAF